MKLFIIKVKTDQQKKILCKLEKEINLLFLSYAKEIGVEDHDLEGRCTEQYGLRYLEDNKYQNYLLYQQDQLVGFFIFQIDKSDYTQKETLILEELYIKPGYRGQGYGTEIISYLQNQYQLPIELNCYYQAPAYQFYEKLGGKVIQIRYLLDSPPSNF